MRAKPKSNLMFAALAAMAAIAPAGAQEFVCIPTCDVQDARMLGVTPPGALSSLSPAALEVTIAIAGDRTDFELGIFDGDVGALAAEPAVDPRFPGGLPPGQDRHWDLGTGTATFEVFEDPGKDGVDLGDLPIATFGSAMMPDNDWFDSGLIATAETARADSGNFFYTLRVSLDPNPSLSVVQGFKVRSTGPATIQIFQQPFAYIAAIGSLGDAIVVYPDPGCTVAPFDGSDPDCAVTTFDGTISFFVGAETSIDELRVWDGDLDHGNSVADGPRDTDDPDTPNDSTAVPFLGIDLNDDGDFDDAGEAPAWASDVFPSSAYYEGIACDEQNLGGPIPPCMTGIGAPQDDTPTNPGALRSPAVQYQIIAPDGRSWSNLNPSGNREWEKFEVSTDPGCVAGGNADYCETELLPAGAYEVRVSGLDMQNLNFFFFTLPLRCVNPDGSPCEELREYRIGDTVWLDLNDDGVQQVGEPGIAGVVIEQVDKNGVTVGRALTDADGRYGYGAEEGDWTVRVSAENFSDDPPSGAVGDRVWLDGDGDGAQDGGEPGIPSVRVVLFDAGGNGAPGGGDDRSLASRLTDGNGEYLFTGLPPGDYFTVVDDASLPAGLSPQRRHRSERRADHRCR